MRGPTKYVYYARIGAAIKIGTTGRLAGRMVALRAEEVLAVEPGSYKLERERHRQFADDLLVPREYFWPSPTLLAHVETVRNEHPIPSLSTTAGRPRRTIAAAFADLVSSSAPVASPGELLQRLSAVMRFLRVELPVRQRALDLREAYIVLHLRDRGVGFEYLQRECGLSAGRAHRMTTRYRLTETAGELMDVKAGRTELVSAATNEGEQA